MQRSESTLGTRVLVSKTSQALIWFWLLVGLGVLLPTPIRDVLLSSPSEAGGAPASSSFGATPASAASSDEGASASGARRSEGSRASTEASGVEPIQDPHRSMAAFYRALSRTARREPGAITRVLHYGDSLIDQDLITGALRERLQAVYGDGGHGFTLAGKPWPWYSQVGVGLGEQTDAWDHLRLIGGRAGDRRLGLGCAAMESRAGRAWAQVRLTRPGAARLEVSYLEAPGGGELLLQLDGGSPVRLSTAGPRPISRFHSIELERPLQRVALSTGGRVRLFGLVLEAAGPGITWENLPIVGARLHQLASLDEAHWAEQLRQRRPDLVVFQFGANDSISLGARPETYRSQSTLVLRRARTVLPRSSCLVIGPLDRLERDARGRLHSPTSGRLISDMQREAALSAGCAFWDGQRGMGGPGAMSGWLREGLVLKDLVHLNGMGGSRFGERLHSALQAGLEAYQRGGGERTPPASHALPKR